VTNTPSVAIIGCGLIGKKRAHALCDCKLRFCCDYVYERADSLSEEVSGAEPATNWKAVVQHPAADIVIVATTHNMLAPIAEAAVRNGKHVLIEKPGAMRAHELDAVHKAAEESGVQVRVGFNHRYHPAIVHARELAIHGVIGDLMYVRGHYGHGGRLGYGKEWRADPKLSGGGELLDQGAHLIDLARWFLGDFTEVQGHTKTYFWDMPVEDNAFLALKTLAGQTAHLHASWTEWKNTFSFEVFGQKGKLEVNGLGGSYGTEQLTLYSMTESMGPPATATWEHPIPDMSWESEFADFLDDIRLHRAPTPGIQDAQAVLRIVEQVYAGQVAPQTAA